MTDPGLVHAIDFGTSTSAIVVSKPDGTLTQVRDPALPIGPPWVRTSVCVVPGGRIAVGQEAENSKRLYPDSYRSEFKPYFGDAIATAPGSLAMTTDEMAVEVVRFLRELAREAVPGEPEYVVATIPASWAAGNRELMRSVLRRAGYADAELDVIPEPVAAVAHAFGDHASLAKRLTVLVYDLGGGTFDCAVARGDAGWYEVLGNPDGKDDVGGAAFDRQLLGVIRERFPGALPPQLDDLDVIRRWLSLKDTCEEIKWRLSAEDQVDELLTELTPAGYLMLSRAEFEAAIRPLLNETLDICEHLLRRQLDMDWPDVDRIAPIGGSSRIPLVGKLLADRSGRPVLTVSEPEMAVVLGAAAIGRNRYTGALPRRVFVNGRQTVTMSQELRFDEVVRLAHDQPPSGRYVTVTVTYSRGPRENPSGSLADGQRVRVASDMVFNVTVTDRS